MTVMNGVFEENWKSNKNGQYAYMYRYTYIYMHVCMQNYKKERARENVILKSQLTLCMSTILHFISSV